MRSLLFVPGHDERKLAKGLASEADALILDLEDAVPMAEKPRARGVTAAFLQAHRATARARLFVRVNALDTGLLLEDLAAVVHARPHGIMLPKCLGGRDVARVGDFLAALEARDGLEVGSTQVLPIVTESAAALLAMASYGEAGPRLCGMLWGGEDLSADVGASANRDAEGRYTAPYALARSLTLMAATAARVPAIDAVFTDFRDPPRLRDEARQALRDGFAAKAAIHPDQVAVIHEAFAPSDAERAWAQRVVDAFDAEPRAGAVSIDGRMLDRPHLRHAQRVLSRDGMRQR